MGFVAVSQSNLYYLGLLTVKNQQFVLKTSIYTQL